MDDTPAVIWQEVPVGVLAAQARIMGPDSTAARVLAEVAKRADDGTSHHIYRKGTRILVGPEMSDEERFLRP